MAAPTAAIAAAASNATAAPTATGRREIHRREAQSRAMMVSAIHAQEGGEFTVTKFSTLGMINNLQNNLTVTENGKGRRSDIDTYRITARGGKGIRNYDASKDKVAAVKIVDDVDDVLLSSQEGIIIRLHVNEIPLQSRYGSGVRVMRLGENDKVMVLARTDHDDEAQTEQIDASEAEAEPTAEQLAEMEAADAAAATETPEADPEEKE